MSSSAPLTPAQTHALFDILIHHQIYAEIEAFKYPSTIDQYGYPFRKADGVQSTSPLLQTMLNKFALCNPAIRNFSDAFWQDKVRTLVAKLAEAELSESYDKGAIGSRKALATAASSIAEYIARGMLGGYPVKKEGNKKQTYDTSKPEDVIQGFDDLMHGLIYGDVLDDMFEKVQATGKLEDHASVVQAAHEYILLNVASFLHHIFIMSPDGQYLVRLLENAHRLIPYMVIKQTLRVGNAASMINGMVKLILAKLSVTAMTNWIGLTNNSNDGMNLLQQIISTVLAWDTSEFQKRASKLESSRDAPDKKIFKTIKSFVYASRDKHEAARSQSISESKSIVAVILENADPPIDTDTLTEHQHNMAMEYYSTYLSIRDREELTKVFCKLQPDMLTSAVREAVSTMDPIIRAIHNAVDLSGTVTDAEAFLTDLIKVSKPKKKTGNKSRETSQSRPSTPTPASIEDQEASDVPTVEDFVQLLRRHAPSLHKFLHQVTKNAPDLANDYLAYAKRIFSEFKVDDAAKAAEEKGEGGAGNMTAPLHSLFESLGKEKQDELKKFLNAHEKHLRTLKDTSQSRLKSIMSSSTTSMTKHSNKGTTHGPGMYLSRWNSLLDSTLITPATIHGPVRRGWEVKGELDGKGLKTSSSLLNPTKSRESSKNRNQNTIMMAHGTGDAVERRERKRDGQEEESMVAVWEGMRDGWVGVCRGLEVMGPD
ncbi:Nn.00g075800.m01.CDS01 [Neocucurbitaria sp. VM-36]